MFINKVVKLWLFFRVFYKFTETYRIEQKYWINGAMKVIEDVIEQKEKSFVDTPQEDDVSPNKPRILIDQLLKHRDKLDNEDIRDEALTMITAVS